MSPECFFGSLIHLTILCTLLLFCDMSDARSTGHKAKYPFYRPLYNETRSIFEPLSHVIDHESTSPSLSPKYLMDNANVFASYHNYSQYMQEISHLIKLSSAAASPWSSILSITEQSASEDGNPLHLIRLTDKSISSDLKQKILMIFGEHPREMIVVESMFDLLQQVLLSYVSSSDSTSLAFSQEYAQSIVQHFEIDIIPMLNPDGKLALESTGNYCWRWTGRERQVDLNRNFDWYFAGKSGSTHRKGTEEWHGTKAFSESEAQYVADLLSRNNYSVVLDIHSGTQQIFVPFVDTESRKKHRIRKETPEEVSLATYIQSHSSGWYKNSGIAWKFNDYGADGTIMDYVGGVAKVEYSLCAEIYGDPNVDGSIDCFVQFNPNNGPLFQKAINGIRSLYSSTFDYLLSAENKLALDMLNTAKFLQRLQL